MRHRFKSYYTKSNIKVDIVIGVIDSAESTQFILPYLIFGDKQIKGWFNTVDFIKSVKLHEDNIGTLSNINNITKSKHNGTNVKWQIYSTNIMFDTHKRYSKDVMNIGVKFITIYDEILHQEYMLGYKTEKGQLPIKQHIIDLYAELNTCRKDLKKVYSKKEVKYILYLSRRLHERK